MVSKILQLGSEISFANKKEKVFISQIITDLNLKIFIIKDLPLLVITFGIKILIHEITRYLSALRNQPYSKDVE